MHPEILVEMLKFIKHHGFAAHNRRRTTTGTSCGVKLDDLRAHVIKNVPGLEKISRAKIHNLLQPARANTKAAARHIEAVEARVAQKRNDVSKEHPDSHEYAAQKKHIEHFAARHSEKVTIISGDSKNKVHIGGQAVSRYHQLRSFFPIDDSPNFMDHDFPTPSYLIEPDGYMDRFARLDG